MKGCVNMETKDFSALGVNLNTKYMVVNNKFNYEICNIAKNTGMLFDLCGNTKGTFCIMNHDTPTQKKVAFSMQCDLQGMGVELADDYYKNNTKLLTGLYNFVGLSCVSKLKKDGSGRNFFMATKNSGVLNFIVNTFNVGNITENKYQKLAALTAPTYEELSNGYLSVIKCNLYRHRQSDETGYRENLSQQLGTERIYPNSKGLLIFPYVPTLFRTSKMLNILKEGLCQVEFYEGKDLRKITTSLADADRFQKALRFTKFNAGAIPLHDLETGKFYVINIFSIKDIARKAR